MKNKKAKLFSFQYLLQDYIRITGALPLLIAYRPKRLYESKEAKKKIKGGALLASNHVGFFDPMCLMITVWYRRHHFVATTEFFSNKYKKFLFSKAFLCLPIDRTKPDIVNVRSIISHLKAEELVTIFPEGHINEDESGDLSEFKSGTALMAVMSGKPVVPVYIQKRKSVLERLKIAIGEPIFVNEEERKKAPLEYLEKFSQQIYEKEMELQNLCRGDKK